MGNANISGPPPNVKSPSANQCSDKILADIDPGLKATSDDITKLKNANAYLDVVEFCAEAGKTKDLGDQVCNNLGDTGEWTLYQYNKVSSCQYNDCDQGYTVSNNGCNGKCCSIAGESISCARNQFLGDPVVCCFNDYACQNDPDKCFQTPARQRTCDPAHRDLTTKPCQDLIEPYCLGEKLFASQNSWQEIWLENSSVEINSDQELSSTIYPSSYYSDEIVVSDRGKRYPERQKQPCLRAIARNITMGKVCSWDDIQEGSIITTNVNQDGLTWSANMLYNVYQKYKKESGGGGLLTGISTDGIDVDAGFYNSLWNICNKVPLLCTNGNDQGAVGILPELCANVTIDDIKKSPDTLKWCACHMPDKEYESYTKRYGISKECTPICNRLGVMPSIDINGERKFCQDNTCIIDKNTIDIVDSEITGGVNFNQICPGCGKNNINRTFTKSSYGSCITSSSGISAFALSNSFSRNFLTNYYDSVYNGGYSLSNFPKNNLTLEVLYLPQSIITKHNLLNLSPISLKPITPAIVKSITGSSSEDLKTYLQKTYKVSEVTVVFGLLKKSNCIGYVNAGFTITKKSGDTIPVSALKSNVFFPGYLPDPDSKTGNYIPLTFAMNQVCSGGNVAKGEDAGGFKPVSNNVYNETIVSETSNKFSSGQVDGKVTSNTCSCTMDGFTLDSAAATVNGSINFTQECGKSKCFGADGKLVSCAHTSNDPVAHNSIEAIEIATAIELEEEKYSYAFYVLGAFLFLLLVCIIFFELRK